MNITAADVMKLRKMTNAGMMDCKKALAEAEGDFTKAVEIIREKGKLVAAKRADRETSEGAVLARVNGSKAAIVCLGCETDFVSATPDFKALANEIADAAAASFPADVEGLKAAPCSNGHSVEEEISVQTGKTGEKHVLAYYATLEAPYIAQYIHFNGKIGAIVAFNKTVDEALGRAVAMQVASMNPVSVGEADCPKEVVEKELEMYKKQMAEDPKMAGKPEAMLENIAKGKLQKFFKEQTLEDQDFVQADEKISVKDYIKKVDAEAKILAFKRFSLSD
ncbi:MAG: translation elongation factor Ts [Candidatus Cryptobacteroides sp.]